MKIKKLFNALTGSLILGSLLLTISGCCSNDYCCDAPCAVQERCCAPYGPDCKPCAVLECCDYYLEKRAPNSVAVGCPFDYVYTLCAKKDVVDVVLTDRVPRGAKYISSNPAAEVSGDMLRWSFPHLQPGNPQELRVTMCATECGCLEDCVKVSVVPYACTVVCVGQPMLEICKDGPCEICIDECATFGIHLRNCGNFRADDVVITDIVPEGMVHASGKRQLSLDVGSLAPGESTSAQVTLRPERGGCFCNVARATSCDGRVVEASACVNVVVPNVSITKVGCPMQYIPHCGICPVADYTITVTNNGDMCLTNVKVTDYVAAGNYIVEAPGAIIGGNTASWCIPTFGPCETQTFNITLRADCPGCYVNEACVRVDDRCKLCECACVQTEWRGHPALLTELIDLCDPLIIGAETFYEVRITNQGTAPDTNITVVGMLPEQVEYVAADGPSAFQVNGKTVQFAPIPCLAPQQSVLYRIKVRAVSPGYGRFKAEIGSDILNPPLHEEESTHIIPDTCGRAY